MNETQTVSRPRTLMAMLGSGFAAAGASWVVSLAPDGSSVYVWAMGIWTFAFVFLYLFTWLHGRTVVGVEPTGRWGGR